MSVVSELHNIIDLFSINKNKMDTETKSSFNHFKRDGWIELLLF